MILQVYRFGDITIRINAIIFLNPETLVELMSFIAIMLKTDESPKMTNTIFSRQRWNHMFHNV